MPVIPDDYMRPEMMAVGDSLFQGVRSLTIKRGLNQLSPPALVAEGLGIRHAFFCPDPARPVLIDMEDWLRKIPDIGAIKEDLADNADYWFTTPKSPSGRLLFDNISVASTTVGDLYSDSWAIADAELKKLPRNAKKKIKKLKFDGLDLGAIVQHLNTRFTLNPGRLAAVKPLTQIGLVKARMPKRLLVNIGSNNGLWDIAFEANPRGRVKLRRELRLFAKHLNALPAEVGHIYFNSLALPSTVPNLMPIPGRPEWGKKPGKGKYYGRYENRFGFGYGTLSGADMERLDKHVIAVNAEAEKILRDAFDDPRRLHFVDLAGLLRQYDAKHQVRAKTNAVDKRNVVRLKNRKALTNVTTEANFWGAFARGGLAGLDGMHLTVPGYSIMAQRILDRIKQAEPGTRTSKLDLNEAFRRDKLLSDMPGVWDLALWLWRDVRRDILDKDAEPETAERQQATATVMDACARCIRTGRVTA